jgi:hypothetical protein
VAAGSTPLVVQALHSYPCTPTQSRWHRPRTQSRRDGTRTRTRKRYPHGIRSQAWFFDSPLIAAQHCQQVASAIRHPPTHPATLPPSAMSFDNDNAYEYRPFGTEYEKLRPKTQKPIGRGARPQPTGSLNINFYTRIPDDQPDSFSVNAGMNSRISSTIPTSAI